MVFVLVIMLLPAGVFGFKKGAKPIKIGYLLELTGGNARDAETDLSGAKLAVQEINEKGGVLGRPIELIVRDNRLNPAISAREAKDLILTKEVQFLAGATVSSCALANSEVAREFKIPYINSTATSMTITEEKGHRYVFSAWANTRTQVGPVGLWCAEQPFKKYVCFTADFSMGRDVTTCFVDTVKKANPKAEFVSQLWCKLGELEFGPYLPQILALKPDVLFLGGIYGAPLVSFVKQARSAGVFDQTKVICFLAQNFLETVPEDMPDGVIGFLNIFHTMDHPWVKDFSRKIRDSSGIYADGSALSGYMAIKWVEAGVKKAGTTDPEKFIDAIEGLTINSFIGPVTMRKADHQATGAFGFGFTKRVPEYPFPIVVNMQYRPGGQFLLPEAEVLKKRGQR
jgi:branched-chain amino acid transport system substrate-binding protein